ncbi:hypothetical protein BDW02DRAFT_44857 [Decorospora gaudefroyi]|uniref:Secreted protein n=1 Tax=Decorospora gaudefroyi TaxID=184978 RepID=A0A6A5KDW4_9PLEO|nr:hypothetical protein BDW02DRAFT_44857 [Decorospora gaudefroyi]
MGHHNAFVLPSCLIFLGLELQYKSETSPRVYVSLLHLVPRPGVGRPRFPFKTDSNRPFARTFEAVRVSLFSQHLLRHTLVRNQHK